MFFCSQELPHLIWAVNLGLSLNSVWLASEALPHKCHVLGRGEVTERQTPILTSRDISKFSPPLHTGLLVI